MPGAVEPAVVDAGREDDGVRADARRRPAELHQPRRAALVERGHARGRSAPRRRTSPPAPSPARSSSRAGDARREAEVVLDPRALPGLAAGGLALDQHRAQPLRRAVDRGGQPGRAAADDRRGRRTSLGGVVVRPDRSASSRVGRRDQRLAVRRDHHAAASARPVAAASSSRWPSSSSLDVEPAVRHLVAGQEVADLGASAPTSGGRPPWMLAAPARWSDAARSSSSSSTTG